MNRLFLALVLLKAVIVSASAISITVIPWDKDVAERKMAIGHSKGSEEMGYLHPFARSSPIKLPAEIVGLRLEATDRLDAEG